MQVIVDRTKAYVQQQLLNESSGHDWWHTYRVWRLALRLAQEECADCIIVQLAALLHDVFDWKIAQNDLEGPQHAKRWLGELGVDESIAQEVATIIKNISFKGALVRQEDLSLEGKIVQDADRLDAIGAIGIARAFAFGGFKGCEIYDPSSKPVLHNSAVSYCNAKGSTINHFYEKLFFLKNRMHTKTAKKMAEKRHEFMESYLKSFFQEWDLVGD